MAATSSAPSGSDFVLFDQTTPSVFGPAPASSLDGNAGFNFSSQSSNPAFTEYRGGDNGFGSNGMGGQAGASGILGNDSPFSSPATKLDDDLGFDAYSPSAPRMGSSISLDGFPSTSNAMPSGTADDTSLRGPRSKKARAAHGYSSSWAGDNVQQHLQQQVQQLQRQRQQQQQRLGQQSQQQGQASGSQFGAQGAPMTATQSFGGFPTGAGPNSDWSGSDSSPRGPPSGSLGPPIQGLSLGDAPGEGMESLFSNANFSNLASLNGSNGFGSPQQQQNAARQAAAIVAAMQQENRARQQIRADLQGVDSRALKGQLRDIQQGGNAGSPVLGNMSMTTEQGNVLFPNVPPSASQSSFDIGSINGKGATSQPARQVANGQALGSQSGNSDQGNGLMPQMSNADIMNALTAAAPMSNNFASSSQQTLSSMPGGSTGSNASQLTAPSPSRRFSDRTQAAVDRARTQVPSRKRMVREGSGLTISPQEAFLDYNNMSSVLQGARGNQPTFPTLFGPASAFNKQSGAGGPDTPRANPAAYSFSEGTPSLVDASSNSSTDGSDSRGTPAVFSPPRRASLNRGDTVVPSAAQREQQRQKDLQSASQSSLWSKGDPSLFSPSDSATDSTEDEDEKPYMPTHVPQQRSQSLDHSSFSSFPPNTQQQMPDLSALLANLDGRAPQGQRTNYTMNSGPRFSFVSSSSSESDDESQRLGPGAATQQFSQGNMVRPRTMGGYGYMGSSNESGMNAVPPSSQVSMPMTSFDVPGGFNSQGMSQPSAFANNPNFLASMAGMSQPGVAWDAPSVASSQSQDEGPRPSPPIRNSAQPLMSGQGFPPPGMQQGGFNLAALLQQGVPFGALGPQQQAGNVVNGQRKGQRGTSAQSEDSMDEDTEDDDVSGSDGSMYRESTTKSTKGRGGSRKPSAAVARKRRSTEHARRGSTSGQAGATTTDGLTICDYVSPITRETCGTEFHRPYDLARHRETIHAREEAMLLKQGQITKDQCNVLYKEVDPAKSLATVEWRCDGPHGCGALFSRKDALLRHKRIRSH